MMSFLCVPRVLMTNMDLRMEYSKTMSTTKECLWLHPSLHWNILELGIRKLRFGTDRGGTPKLNGLKATVRSPRRWEGSGSDLNLDSAPSRNPSCPSKLRNKTKHPQCGITDASYVSAQRRPRRVARLVEWPRSATALEQPVNGAWRDLTRMAPLAGHW